MGPRCWVPPQVGAGGVPERPNKGVWFLLREQRAGNRSCLPRGPPPKAASFPLPTGFCSYRCEKRPELCDPRARRAPWPRVRPTPYSAGICSVDSKRCLRVLRESARTARFSLRVSRARFSLRCGALCGAVGRPVRVLGQGCLSSAVGDRGGGFPERLPGNCLRSALTWSLGETPQPEQRLRFGVSDGCGGSEMPAGAPSAVGSRTSRPGEALLGRLGRRPASGLGPGSRSAVACALPPPARLSSRKISGRLPGDQRGVGGAEPRPPRAQLCYWAGRAGQRAASRR